MPFAVDFDIEMTLMCPFAALTPPHGSSSPSLRSPRPFRKASSSACHSLPERLRRTQSCLRPSCPLSAAAHQCLRHLTPRRVGSESRSISLPLPIPLTKFITPAPMSRQDFDAAVNALGSSNSQSAAFDLPPPQCAPDSWRKLLQLMKFAIIETSHPNLIAAAGNLERRSV